MTPGSDERPSPEEVAKQYIDNVREHLETISERLADAVKESGHRHLVPSWALSPAGLASRQVSHLTIKLTVTKQEALEQSNKLIAVLPPERQQELRQYAKDNIYPELKEDRKEPPTRDQINESPFESRFMRAPNRDTLPKPEMGLDKVD